jgi:putative transposase
MANPRVQTSLESNWRTADTWLTGYYLIMPDHIHLFCAPRDLRFTIEKWSAYWKSQFSRAHLDEPTQWQRKAFHHRLRSRQEYTDKWNYVRENPVRAGLATHPDEWPYQGTINELRW